METILSFFSDLILFSAGLVVLLIWVVIICAVIIEVSDNYREKKNPTDTNEVNL